MKKETFLQTKTIEIPGATAATVIRSEVKLNSSYERCTGVAIYPIKQGGVDAFRVGLDDNGGALLQVTHQDALTADKSLPFSDRFQEINVPANGHTVKINTQFDQQTTEALKYDFVFRLERTTKL
ncbi:hypothetical protein [Persicobacter diffluens]|uniref:Uncharacterized protein n=1 Tax=Persicobacter diffluens TaxID=981 RepID=A0AAN4W489_9BACT|nr:hypothetical protein PEDI_55250 [Persicobacter diffluens]